MGNVEAPCLDQRPQRRELGNIPLAYCPWNSGIWQTAKTRFVTLLRNSNTKHWAPFRAPPTFGKFVNSLSGKSSHARIILDSCHNSMSIRWCKYAATEQHKKHACTLTRSVLQLLEENRSPGGQTTYKTYRNPSTPYGAYGPSDDKNTFRGLRNLNGLLS